MSDSAGDAQQGSERTESMTRNKIKHKKKRTTQKTYKYDQNKSLKLHNAH
jgi:hypothetical protein